VTHVGCVKVAAVVGRADLLSAFCFMSAFILYVCAVHSGLLPYFTVYGSFETFKVIE